MLRDECTTQPSEDDVGPIDLRFRREAAFFFARHLHRLDLSDLDFVLALAKEIPPSVNGCYIIVPMHVSESTLDRYLQLLVPQLLVSSATVVVFANATMNQVSVDDFGQQIKRARECVSESSAVPRTVLAARLFDSPVTMGRLRGLLADAVLVNAYLNRVSHPIIISNDIDALAVADNYIETFARRFNSDRTLKLAAGMVDYGYRGAVSAEVLNGTPVPELYVFNELNKAINRCARNGLINYERRVWIEGANAAFSGAAYCASGGFDFEMKSGEDDSLGRALNRLNPNAFIAETLAEATLYVPDPILRCSLEADCWVLTDPRRILMAIASGLPGIEAWADRPFMETVGATMSAADLALQCANHPALITPTKLVAAAKGSADARYAVVS
ncbi:MAG: hypothetical protein ACRER3_18310, partial [Pseudomonas fluorescens]